MGSNSTIYDVKVRYALDDKTSKGANGMSSSMDKAAQSAFSLRGALAAVGGGILLVKAKAALVDFNSDIEKMKIGLSTVMQMQLHMPFKKANDEANKLFSTFQEIAKKSPATTKDFMEMANAIAPGVGLAGGGTDKLVKLTQGAVLASIALGERADMVALDIKQMLMGTVTNKDRTAMQLLGGMGVDKEKFNAMSAKERAETTEQAFTQPALKTAADQFEKTYAGQMSTLQDTVQIALGQVGLPLMKAMTAEVSKWNEWITKHPKQIQSYVTSFAGMIKDAFTFVKSVGSWLVDNKELLFAIGKTFLVFKGAQMGVNVIKDVGRNLAGFVGDLQKARNNLLGGAGTMGPVGAFGKLGKVLTGVGGVIPALGLFVGALGIVSTLLNQHAESDKKARDAALSLQEATGEIPGLMDRRKNLKSRLNNPMFAGTREEDQNELNAASKKMLDPEMLGTALRKIDEESVKHGGGSLKSMSLAELQQAFRQMPDTFDSTNIKENTRIMKEVEATLNLVNGLTMDARREVLKHAFPDRWGTPAGPATAVATSTWGGDGPKTANVNVTIHKIEVASEDPDRFVFGLVRIGEQAAKHPTASQHATPGGM